jgi:hypothetical protein
MIFNKKGTEFIMDTEMDNDPDFLMIITNATTWVVSVGPIAEFLPEAGSWSWEAVFYSEYLGGQRTLYTGELIVE